MILQCEWNPHVNNKCTKGEQNWFASNLLNIKDPNEWGNDGTGKVDTITERIENFDTYWQSAWMLVLKISYSLFREILIHRKAIGAVARHPDWSVSGSYFDRFERIDISTSSTRKKPSFSMKNSFTRSAASWGLFAKERVGTCLRKSLASPFFSPANIPYSRLRWCI